MTKNTTTFFIITGLLTLTVLKAFEKSLVVFWNKSLYYCQNILKITSFHLSPLSNLIIIILIIFAFLFSLIKLTLIIINTFRFKKELLKKETIGPKKIRSLFKKLEISSITKIIESKKPFAFCFGLINPKIYISTALIKKMTLEEIEAILQHETYHLEHKDTIIMTIAVISRSFLIFFPFLDDFIYNLRLKREIEADKKAISKGKKKPLIRALEKLIICPFPSFEYTQSFADEETLEKRVFVLSGKKKENIKLNQIKITLSLIFFVFFLNVILTSPKTKKTSKKTSQKNSACLVGRNCSSNCHQYPNAFLKST